jgi:type IV secretory pathway TraG/TraD family ATPase VirD4
MNNQMVVDLFNWWLMTLGNMIGPSSGGPLETVLGPILLKMAAIITFIAMGLVILRVLLWLVGYLLELIFSKITYWLANRRETRAPTRLELKQFKQEDHYEPYDLFKELRKFYMRKGLTAYTFIGLDAQGSNRASIAIKDTDRMKHTQVIGMTGTGKTTGVFLPIFLQDAAKNRPVIFIDPKGEWDTIDTVDAIGNYIERPKDLFCFLLSHPQHSCTYNPLYAPGCDPDVIIDAFLSNFISDNSYYRDVSITLFRHAYKILHSMQQPFTVMDIYAYLNNEKCFDESNLLCKGNPNAEKHLLLMDGEIRKLNSQHKNWRVCLIGLNNYLMMFDHPLLNEADADIDLYDCILYKKMVYFQLPTNAYPVLAPVIGRMVQANLRYLSSLIQTKHLVTDSPISLIIDEYGTFADETFLEVLNKARSSGIMVTLGHQSMSDLTAVSESFMRRIDENTLNKIILKQTDPKLCEHISRSIGTFKKQGRTYREAKGFFW